MANKDKIVGLIPIREGSQRVKEKNFREFANGKSLFEIKIDQLKQAGCFDHIYVSSDSAKAKKIALANGAEFLPRDSRMCQSDVLLAEVIMHIMETIPGDPIVVWALATSPLFSDFAQAVKKYLEVKKDHDSLIAVLPKKSFFLNKHGRGINYNPGYWHPYSQQLETWYEVTGACYIGRKSDMLKWSYWFGTKPYLYEVKNSQ
ncbi:MAG: CMP-N-acetylneuraminic acid synthetase, partial [Candidatus Margulisbacteria bacterium]|nr:CMP-N-acetylneuraminic acid synthetase [Candidatus Margulisiibacteriota bacterium]